jgi:hypothetical protein
LAIASIANGLALFTIQCKVPLLLAGNKYMDKQNKYVKGKLAYCWGSREF